MGRISNFPKISGPIFKLSKNVWADCQTFQRYLGRFFNFPKISGPIFKLSKDIWAEYIINASSIVDNGCSFIISLLLFKWQFKQVYKQFSEASPQAVIFPCLQVLHCARAIYYISHKLWLITRGSESLMLLINTVPHIRDLIISVCQSDWFNRLQRH